MQQVEAISPLCIVRSVLCNAGVFAVQPLHVAQRAQFHQVFIADLRSWPTAAGGIERPFSLW